MDKDTLIALWTSGDRDTALKMVFMYSKNAKLKGWWKNITLIIWGASAQLAMEDDEIRGALKSMAEAGVKLEACKACADMYGASESLEELGVDVKYMGLPFTGYLKDGYSMITI